ncbi:hypothetical protein DINM_004180 [Dirofilaria immitis]|nr:hypothetical protein [Dirofilaria immitis]
MNHSVAIKYGTVGDSLVPLFALPYHFTLMVNRFPLVDEEVHENNEIIHRKSKRKYEAISKSSLKTESRINTFSLNSTFGTIKNATLKTGIEAINSFEISRSTPSYCCDHSGRTTKASKIYNRLGLYHIRNIPKILSAVLQRIFYLLTENLAGTTSRTGSLLNIILGLLCDASKNEVP